MPAQLPTSYAMKDAVDALRVHCRWGVREDGAGWVPDPAACPAVLSLGDAAVHAATCDWALETCPFAGCGVQRRRRDAEAHDRDALLAHLQGERAARVEAQAALQALEARVNARLQSVEQQLAAADATREGDEIAQPQPPLAAGTLTLQPTAWQTFNLRVLHFSTLDARVESPNFHACGHEW